MGLRVRGRTMSDDDDTEMKLPWNKAPTMRGDDGFESMSCDSKPCPKRRKRRRNDERYYLVVDFMK
jgi:hypothetical protein